MSMNGSNKIFVGNLSFNTTPEELESTFKQFGEIVDARIIKDRATDKSRGFGFVTFKDPADAKKALEFNNKELKGRSIRVNEAKDKERY